MNKETISYLKNFFRDPNVASFGPSSQRAIEKVCRRIDFTQAETLVEYGPGGGCFTQYLLERMKPSSRLIAFETNPDFVAELRDRFTDSRLRIVQASAETLNKEIDRELDYVISGIPFSFLKPEVRDSIIKRTHDALKDGGSFLTYQVIVPPARFDNVLLRPMSKYFKIARVEYELLNLPPYRIYEGVKQRKGG
jgi:phospholipid N-methyltransferase